MPIDLTQTAEEEKYRLFFIPSCYKTYIFILGIFRDNVGIKSVVFNPSNGTIFESNKYHKVVATITDQQNNVDTCVMEVYVKGRVSYS